MFARTTEEVFENITRDTTILVAETDVFDKLLIQDLVREVNGREIRFMALRNIVVKEKERNKGYFKKVVQTMLDTGRPVLLDDIINNNVYSMVKGLGFKNYAYTKRGKRCHCLYFLQ